MASIASINCVSVIKNGVLARISPVYAPFSKMTLNVLALLEKEGVIAGFRANGRFILISIVNSDAARQRLRDLKVISKPSNPVFVSLRTLVRIDSFSGSSLDALVILNTTRGVVTMKDAIRFGVGGELLFSGSSLVTELIPHK